MSRQAFPTGSVSIDCQLTEYRTHIREGLWKDKR